MQMLPRLKNCRINRFILKQKDYCITPLYDTNKNNIIMKKNLFIFTFLLGVFSLSAQAQKQEKTITVEVQNNWNQAKADAPVVINLHVFFCSSV